jgi:hypothetical protein
MKCHEVRAMLPAYLDRTLSPTERSIVQLHLKECHECQKVLQSYSSVQKIDSVVLEPIKMKKKTGFTPRKSKTKRQDVQTKLQEAGLIAPEMQEYNQEPVQENSGEELLRKHMLAILSEEEEKYKTSEPEVEIPKKVEIPDVVEIEEPEFQWTRDMSLESAMSGGIIEEQNQVGDEEEAVVETSLTAPFNFSSTANWQDDPDQFVEIPYIHPVTRSEVLKKVRRNSMEGILFLESEAEKKREATIHAEEAELPFETIPVNQSVEIGSFDNKLEMHEGSAAEIAKARLYQQLNEDELLTDRIGKPRTINQTIKTLPFRENTKKQAILYRFFTVVLLTILSLVTFFLWKNGSIFAMSGVL